MRLLDFGRNIQEYSLQWQFLDGIGLQRTRTKWGPRRTVQTRGLGTQVMHSEPLHSLLLSVFSEDPSRICHYAVELL